MTASWSTQARETGICPVREELYAQCFDELIRQVKALGFSKVQIRNLHAGVCLPGAIG